ncbi:bifunctional phosphoribosylaminoimidazolecarboxamide formyltransferase/IMP cyclohydrolase [Candidatus Neomarinimicrobiota bacterium]
MKRAFISVWDKSGLAELVRFLVEHKFEIISTGGTAVKIEELGIRVTPVEEVTGQPAMMDGRLKTLDLRVFGPILFDRDKPQHYKDLKKLGQAPIDLVVVNLYPFAEKSKLGLSENEMIEYIDIGGPSLLRAAAKNFQHVTVLSGPDQYARFMQQYDSQSEELPLQYRKGLAVEVFECTAEYDRMIADYFAAPGTVPTPRFSWQGELHQALRYGENPHQRAGFYLPKGAEPEWEQLHGKELSFNNYADIETAYQIASEFDQPAAAIIKHANPCGFAIGSTPEAAFSRALSTDPVSSFGGIVGINRNVDLECAEAMAEIFLECIIAPGFSEEALDRFTRKKNIRLLVAKGNRNKGNQLDMKAIAGGLLIQDSDQPQPSESWKVVSDRQPTESEMEALSLGWKLVRFVKSNAIVFSNNRQILGVGAGQMSRIDSVQLAGMKADRAELDLVGSALASDAFFPFPDGVAEAAKLGATAVIQPGGSVRDKEVIAEVNRLNLAMVFTGIRHFRH